MSRSVPFDLVIKGKRTLVFKDQSLVEKRQTLQQNFDNLTSQLSLTVDALRSATQGTVSDIALLKSANLMLMLKIDANLLPSLFESAMKLGYTLGLKTPKAIESLSIGLARQSRMVLDNLGIIFKVDEALAWYKSKHKKQKLTQADKREAWIEYAIHRLIEQAKPLILNMQQVRREQYYANVQNAKSEP